MNQRPESSPAWLPTPRNDFFVQFWLNVSSWQESSSFYFINICACWKNNGLQCDGDITTDVTRYILYDLHQKTDDGSTCEPHRQHLCPEFHTTITGSRIHRSDTSRFPYDAYVRVGPAPDGTCGGYDCFSNPQEQDFIKVAPSAEWVPYGFPTSAAAALIPGDWKLNVGQLTARIKMQGTEPSVRRWHTFNIGPEMGLGGGSGVSMWEIAGFDVLVQSNSTEKSKR